MCGSDQFASPETVTVEQNRERAIDLRAQGLTYLAIGKALGLSKSRAHELVHEALREQIELNASKTQELLELECARSEELIRALWDRRSRPRYADSILRASKRIAELRGLDAPKRNEIMGAGGAPLVPPGAIVVQLVDAGDGPPRG